MHGVPGLKPVLGAAARAYARGRGGLQAGRHDHADRRRARRRPGRTRAGCCCSTRCKKSRVRGRRSRDASGEHRAARARSDRSSPPADLDSDFLRALGLARQQPPLPPVIGNVVAGGAAERAGLKAGDEIVAIDNRRRSTRVGGRRRRRARASRAAAHARSASASDARTTVPVTPEVHHGERQPIGRIGAGPKVDRAALAELMTEVRYGPLESIGKARLQDVGHVGLQPADARQDDRRRSVAQESERADHDRGLRGPVGADGLDFVSAVSRADQHQSRRAQSAARSRYWMAGI